MSDGSIHSIVLRCPRNVECHIVGVCHLSQISIDEARSTVEAVKPDIVCLELCEERQELLFRSHTHMKDADGDVSVLLPPLSWNAVQVHWRTFLDPIFWVVHLQLMGLEALLGVRIGAEQQAAAQQAALLGSQIYLIDRRQSVTVARTIAAIANFAAIRDLVRALRNNSEKMPELAKAAFELEMLLVAADMSDSDFDRASALARKIVDSLLNSPHPGSFGRGGEPIQEERDFLLSHQLYHHSCKVPPGGRIVAVLGAAHTQGVVKHFETFRQRGGTSNEAVRAEALRLSEVDWTPVYGVLGVLVAGSCVSFAGRWALVRHLRRTRGPHMARRFNIASATVASGLCAFGLYRAQRQYSAVRRLQLRRRSLTESAEIAAVQQSG